MILSKLLKHSYSKVFVPATVSNVGPGFDTFGFALNDLGDIIEARVNDTGELKIISITGDKEKLSYGIGKNTASVAALSLLTCIKADFGIDLIINKRMPFSSGLGSSAASAVGGAIAVNALLQSKLPDDKLILHALEGENIASAGNIHADNVAPALYGGFTIVRDLNPVDIINIPYPENLACLIIYPHMSISTKESRLSLPKLVPIGTAVKQSANSGALIAGIITKNYNLISRSMLDSLAEPSRVKLIPFYKDIKNLMFYHGALNFNLSGSGPTFFSFFENISKAESVKIEMVKALADMNIESDVYSSLINLKGPEILELV
jgi:homoserine kinase